MSNETEHTEVIIATENSEQPEMIDEAEIKVKSASNSENTEGENTGESINSESSEEPERIDDSKDTEEKEENALLAERRKNTLLDQAYRNFVVSKNKAYYRDTPKKIAFKDKGGKIFTKECDERVCFSMVSLAQVRKWKNIRVRGSLEFKRMIWLEASLRGIEAKGYSPKEFDLMDLERRKKEMDRNSSDQASKNKQLNDHENEQDKEIGKLISHGKAPYENDLKNNPSYYVTLTTRDGEKTLWGVDLKRALEESGSKEGDTIKASYLGKQPVMVTKKEYDDKGKVVGVKEIETHRNTWLIENTEKQRNVEGRLAPTEQTGTDKDKQPEPTYVTLLEHGKAPYENNPKNNNSYFAKVITKKGEKVLWGIDLERAIKESGAKKGDLVEIEHLGSQPVTIKKKEYDEKGKVILERDINTHRNTWNVERKEQEANLRSIAEKVAISKNLPAEVAQKVISSMNDRIDKRAENGEPLEVPVYDKNISGANQDIDRIIAGNEKDIEKQL